MRISDWSSDVCSSDLDLAETQALGQPQFKQRLDALMQRLVRVERACRNVGIDGVGQKLAPHPCAICRHVPRHRPGAAARADFGRPASLDIQRNALLRSEEHTSELQSILRNPYSVFCLK